MKLLRTFLFFVILIPTFAFAEVPPVLTPYLLVSGSGEATAVPDVASVTLGIEAKNRVAKAAMETVNEHTHAIIDLAKKFTTSEQDIQTANLSLGQDYSVQNQQLFLASSTVQVSIKDLSKVGDFIGAAVEGGANTIQNIQFKVSNTDHIYELARQNAFKNVQEKAQQLAKLANRQLGKVIAIEEGSSGGNDFPRPQYRMAAMDSAPAVSPGQLQFSIALSVRYELQ